MADLDLRLLGGFEVVNASGTPLTFATAKARALLALLGRHPGRRHGREALVALLWPESAEPQARTNLRQTLKQIRRPLGDLRDRIVTDEADTLALNPEVVEVDAARFEALHAEGTPEALEAAARLYRGEFLEGVSLREGSFMDWVALERVHLGERALDILARLSAHLADAGQTERAIAQALRLLALDPLQEQSHRLLMRLTTPRGGAARRSSSTGAAGTSCGANSARDRSRRPNGSITRSGQPNRGPRRRSPRSIRSPAPGRRTPWSPIRCCSGPR